MLFNIWEKRFPPLTTEEKTIVNEPKAAIAFVDSILFKAPVSKLDENSLQKSFRAFVSTNLRSSLWSRVYKTSLFDDGWTRLDGRKLYQLIYKTHVLSNSKFIMLNGYYESFPLVNGMGNLNY